MYKLGDEIYFEIGDFNYKSYLKNNIKKCRKSPMINTYLKSLLDEKNIDSFIPTGIESLDVCLGGGLRPGLFIFGANPGVGKTSFILHLMNNLALNNNLVVLFNLEMSPNQITTKLLSNYSYRKSLDNEKFKAKTINELAKANSFIKDEDFKKELMDLILDFQNNIDKRQIIINKSENLPEFPQNNSDNVEQIGNALSNLSIISNSRPIIIIDFLQLLKIEFEEGEDQIDKRLEMNKIIEKLKMYSNVHQATIIVISSLSRRSYTKELLDTDNADYNMSVFKESGMIEYQADFLGILTKGQKVVEFGGINKSIINLSVLKTRFSSHSDETFSLTFIPDYSYFEEVN